MKTYEGINKQTFHSGVITPSPSKGKEPVHFIKRFKKKTRKGHTSSLYLFIFALTQIEFVPVSSCS